MKNIKVNSEYGDVTVRLRGEVWYARKQHLGKRYERRLVGRTEESAIEEAKAWLGRIMRGMFDVSYDGEPTKQYISRVFYNAKKRSLARKIPYELTKEQEEKLYLDSSGRCAITGISFRMGNTESCYRAPYAPSLDRKNPALGYTIDNVRIVCVAVNWALSDWGEGVLRVICTSYAANLLREHYVGHSGGS